MNTSDGDRMLLAGAAGPIEIALGNPGGTLAGIALIAHPHPLYGGTLDNKVVQTLARTFGELGYVSVRPNFRGVGQSGGSYDHGIGETDDLLHVARHARETYGDLPIALAGFSFGAFVQTRVARQLTPQRMVLVGTAAGSFAVEPVPADTIVIHGEVDETVPLAAVFDWARPQDLPVVVIPGADHFFHRRLHIIRRIVQQSWRF